jgi:hypothetical protein
MNNNFSALDLAKKTIGECVVNKENSKKPKKDVSETQRYIWSSDGKISMDIPIDGWNSIHWYRYFCIKFKEIYEQMYTGKQKIDLVAVSSFLFIARKELEMSSSEIKDCLDWIGKERMKYSKNIGKIYYIGLLKEDLNDFYNKYVFQKKHFDEKNKTKHRDIVIENKDLREFLQENIKINTDGSIVFDERILIQLGFPIIFQYLSLQENFSLEDIKKNIFPVIQKIINEDIKNNGIKKSERFERIIKNSILFEPYPFNDFKWREMFEKAIDFLSIKENNWWRDYYPYNKTLKVAGCLKILKSKKRARK